jgi:hypothetical protein
MNRSLKLKSNSWQNFQKFFAKYFAEWEQILNHHSYQKSKLINSNSTVCSMRYMWIQKKSCWALVSSSQRRTGGMTQGVGPEFKPRYCNK